MIVFASISFECSRSTGTFQVNLLSVLGAIHSHENVRLDVICGCNSEDRERLENAYQDFLQSKIADELKATLSEVPPARDDNTVMLLQAAACSSDIHIAILSNRRKPISTRMRSGSHLKICAK